VIARGGDAGDSVDVMHPDHFFQYVECDIPPGLTIAEYRRARYPVHRRRRMLRRIWRLLI
jgi:hypothetical protein